MKCYKIRVSKGEGADIETKIIFAVGMIIDIVREIPEDWEVQTMQSMGDGYHTISYNSGTVSEAFVEKETDMSEPLVEITLPKPPQPPMPSSF